MSRSLSTEDYPGAVEAGPFIRASIARELRVARELAELTPERLAARVGKSANFIRESEAGRAQVTERYVFALLRACRLPACWKADLVQVDEVEALDARRLRVAFTDGSSGTADMTYLIDIGGVFDALRDETTFRNVYVQHGAVTWTPDVDVAPEGLYARVHGLPEPDSFDDVRRNEEAVAKRMAAGRAMQGRSAGVNR